MRRYLYIILLLSALALLLLFKLQNVEVVTVSLLSLSVSMPLSLLLVCFYVLGMFTGGVVFRQVRMWMHKARRPRRKPAARENDAAPPAPADEAGSHS